MALPPSHKANFNTMLLAAKHGDLALLDCTATATGEPVAVICMVQRGADDDFSLIPVARMFDGNPYDEVTPP
jgi:hypothetical protein